MQAHYINKIARRKRFKVTLVVNYAVVHRNSSYHRRTFRRKFQAERLGVAVAGKIHNRLRAHINCAHNFLHFNVIVSAVARNSKIYVDFCAQHASYALRIKACVLFICRNSNFSLCYKCHKRAFFHIFLLGYLFKFRRYNSFPRRVHLCSVFHFFSYRKDFIEKILSSTFCHTGSRATALS